MRLTYSVSTTELGSYVEPVNLASVLLWAVHNAFPVLMPTVTYIPTDSVLILKV